MKAAWGRLGRRLGASFAIAREPLPTGGLHLAAGLAIRGLCIAAWLAYVPILLAIGLFTWVAVVLIQAFPLAAVVSVPFTIGIYIAIAAGLLVLATGISIAMNRLDRQWRETPDEARFPVVAVAALWLLPSIVFARWHWDALQDAHHWTVHLLTFGWLPLLPAVAAGVLVLFWRPPATPSSS